ncbi:RICIN domain-containing protein [Pseudoxanthomonas mexicana]|uniref:RICIN domain-containing protein n=1 Tax=Pseudoxanthomonas mexicana TaxID=128785 RepID=UPI001FD6A237|nr:RICIN domain-containing protein [Pseudoxanthomonas mexicana]UOV00446.1 RICIN domain-containing protein [Pseudoxanthomonas mexicana]
MNKILIALIIGTIMALSPHKDAAAQQYSYIQVDNNPGKCLDFDTAGATPYLQVWGCAGAAAYNQRWYWHYVMSYSGSAAYMLQNAATGTCVGVQNQSLGNAAKLVQVWCNSTDPSQHWIRLTRDANISSRSKYMNGNSGKCMDIYSTSNGTAFQQYDCATSSYWAPQMFRASLIPDGT